MASYEITAGEIDIVRIRGEYLKPGEVLSKEQVLDVIQILQQQQRNLEKHMDDINRLLTNRLLRVRPRR